MEIININEVNQFLNQYSEWKLKNNQLIREYTFKDFKEAFSFMTLIALKAEDLDHHPDWKNVYNKLEIILYTHTAKGITQLDIEMAKYIEEMYNKLYR